MIAVRAIVKGRVQGVGFRNYVAKIAADLGVSGEVWNRADGAVEIHAGHAESKRMQHFLSQLEKGPGIVSEVKCEGAGPVSKSGFLIGVTR